MPPASRTESAPSAGAGRPRARCTSPVAATPSAARPIVDPVGGLHEVGVPQQPDTQAEQDERQHERRRGRRCPADDRVHAVPHPPGQPPPLPGRDDDGQPDEEQAEPVAPVRGVEVAGARADRAGRSRR